jgi:hypothetical protein
VAKVDIHLPKKVLIIVLPILRSNPPLVVGTPVFLAMLFLAPLIPSNLLNANENPYFHLNPNIIFLY